VFALSIWPRGLAVNAVAAKVLSEGGRSLDAVEAALRFNEDDVSDHSTGWGGLPNTAGEVELDAAIMCGPSAEAGAVGALKDTRYAISVARGVMEKTPHLLLVGEAAKAFAREEGFPEFDLLTEESRRRWEEWRRQRAQPDRGAHDTMGTIAIDRREELAVGVTTSGLGYKLPGRVGDSAIVGAGLYCDQQVGGALATGVGEEAMRICATFLVVELMTRGQSPEAACREALGRVVKVQGANARLAGRPLSLAALRVDGEAGGASLKEGFAYARFDGEENRLFPVELMAR
jgi:N4-(beta-N-acetylglucosaminyl)-L-asparaginase